jgi:2-polyprenyl-6-methoxyphenol hydroxylase-like FAD-dependent oxidoreductase
VARIIVLGGGVCGLAAGILLRRDGHEVTVLERDGEPVPSSADDAWERWPRDGVTQFRQTHYMTARGREVLDVVLPDVRAQLAAAGAVTIDPLQLLPPAITDRAPREGDERFITINARRSTVEQVLARAAQAEAGLEIRRGVTVTGLVAGAYDGVPHISGVRTEAGQELGADLIVDAMGRRSQLPRWLEAAGAGPIHEEAEDSGFLYYTRYFRARNGGTPEFRAPLLSAMGTFSILTMPADGGTWSVTLYAASGDQPLKQLREVDAWTGLLAACPLHAHWLDGEPITGVMAMGGIVDRYRRLFYGARPVATGVALAGDAWACTNPSLGRGMTLALMHARRLRDIARSHLDDPREFAEAWDAVTESELTPWYRETVEEDRARLRQIEVLRGRGRAPDPASDRSAAARGAMFTAFAYDPDVFRAFIGTRNCLWRIEEACADERLFSRMIELAHDARPLLLPGPDREQLLSLLAASPAPA